MNLFGQHRVSYESIRRLTIECFALNAAAHALLKQSDYQDEHSRTLAAYEELVSEKLLHLAIALRTKFYQGVDHRTTSGFLEDTGLFARFSPQHTKESLYTLKDVCDKIIHASTVNVTIEEDWEAELLALYGQQTVAGKKEQWVLTLVVPALCKAILGWLDALEA